MRKMASLLICTALLSPLMVLADDTVPTAADDGYSDKSLTRSQQYLAAEDAYSLGYQSALKAASAQNVMTPPASSSAAPAATQQTTQDQQIEQEERRILAQSGSTPAASPGVPHGQGGSQTLGPSCPTQSACSHQGVYGYGKDEALADALKQIVPSPCWQTNVDPLLATRLVTWDGQGRPWQDVLRDLAGSNGFYAALNKDKCIVGIGNTGSTAEALAAGEKAWLLEPGKTLADNLAAWAKEAHWQFAYNTVYNYEIAYPATIVGNFDGPAGAVATVIGYYHDAEHPLTYNFTENHVLVIREAGFTQGASQ
jgi:hypothetical protein